MKKTQGRQRILAFTLSAALVFGTFAGDIPAVSRTAQAASDSASAEDIVVVDADREHADECAAVVATSSDTEDIATISMVEGEISEYGEQTITFVNQDGETVDPQEEAETISGVTAEDVQAIIQDTTEVSAVSSVSSSSEASDAYSTVRNQGNWDVCWAFAATAVMELNAIKTGSAAVLSVDADTLDLSERHLAWFAKNTKSTLSGDMTKGKDGVSKTTAKKAYVGGSYYEAVACLARGSGMELEENAPYSDDMGTLQEADRYDSTITLHDSYSVSYDVSSVENTAASITAVKALVDTYGAAGCSYYSGDNWYTTTEDGKTAYYQDTYDYSKANHAVCIVGYNDDYDASNFTAAGMPDADGAWLVRNSWGSSWGDDGYFWLSYYDTSISSVYSLSTANSTEYGEIYQYDAAGYSTYIGVQAAANVFQAEQDDTLNSVGIYLVSPAEQVTVQVYTSSTKSTNPTLGDEPVMETTVTASDNPNLGYAGYHILDLETSVDVAEGEYFSIVVTIGTSGDTACYVFEGTASKYKASKGQSYYLYGDTWFDSYALCKNACIKALMASETDTTALSSLITQAETVTSGEVDYLGGDAFLSLLQTEISLAEAAVDSKTSDDVARSEKRLERLLSQISSVSMYVDSKKTTGPGSDGVLLYLNGGKYKKNGTTTSYGSKTLYYSVDKVYSWKYNKKKKQDLPAYYGNYVVAVTSDLTMPTLNSDGKVENADTAAAAVVQAKLSGKKVTVKPLSEGTVYVWVLYYPKGGKCYSTDVDDYAVTKVTVGGTAPTAVKLYNAADEAANCSDSTITQFTSAVVPETGTVSVYVAGTTGSAKKKTLADVKLDGSNYEAVVPTKYQSYITAKNDTEVTNKITFTVSSGILDAFKVKSGKKLTVNIPVYCIRNGKKATFKLVIGNPVKSITLADGTVGVKMDGNNIARITLGTAATSSSIGTFTETKALYNEEKSGTDGTTILRMAKADDIIYNASNVVKVSTSLSAEQKKISMTRSGSTYKITAKKGTASGTTVYFVIYHNAYVRQSGAGYQIIEVTVE